MKTITGINHIGLRVVDLAKARAFYELLGFEFIIGPIGPEPVAVMEHPSGININFILNATPSDEGNILMDISKKHPGYTHMALEINDLDAILELLKTNQIQITEGPINFPDGVSVFIRDQDRNVIEFHKPS